MFAHLVTVDATENMPSEEGSKRDALKSAICKVLDIAPNDLAAEVPLTAYGLDSLSASTLSYALAPILRISQIQLLADLSLRDLQARWDAERECTDPTSHTPQDKHEADVDSIPAFPRSFSEAEADSRVRDMLRLADKYGSHFPPRRDDKTFAATQQTPTSVLVTGTTGSLGAHLLVRLLQSPDVEKVYAFLRKRDDASPLDRQRSALKARGLDGRILESEKLVILQGDLAAQYLGLELSQYEEVSSLCHDSITYGS